VSLAGIRLFSSEVQELVLIDHRCMRGEGSEVVGQEFIDLARLDPWVIIDCPTCALGVMPLRVLIGWFVGLRCSFVSPLGFCSMRG
jgi:hypothetical protein